MISLATYHPVAAAVYFLAVTGISMFTTHPVLAGLSLLSALGCDWLRPEGRRPASHRFPLLLFVVTALINPIFSHNGKTVLFVVNDAPVTMEALLYGIVMAAAITATLYRFRTFTAIMTEDRLLCLFGRLSPRFSLLLSMGLRYVRLLTQRWHKIRQTQTALGLYREDNIVDTVRGNLRIFSILITWSLETGILTADSMSARGYGIGKRTHFTDFTFRRRDGVFLAATLVLFAVTAACLFSGAADFTFYPTLSSLKTSDLYLAGCGAYGLLGILPILIEGGDALKWHILRSKI